MKTRTIRDITLLLPDVDANDLTSVAKPPRSGSLVEALVTGGPWVGWHIGDRQVRQSRFIDMALTNATFSQTAITGCTFTSVDLSGSRWSGMTLDRTVFTGCRLLGAHLATVSLRNVIFEDCRLDYATLDCMRTTGPVAFLGCTFAEATIARAKAPEAILDRCRLSRTELINCDLRGADLRGCDLTTIAGVASLAGTTIDQAQLPDLIAPLVHDLDLQVIPSEAGSRPSA